GRGAARATLSARAALPPPPVTTLAHQPSTALSGRVVDAVTRMPLAQVTVRLDSVSRFAITDAQGRYTISDIAPGTYGVTARRLGYLSQTRTVRVTNDSATVHVDFALAAQPTKLDEVVTTAVGDQRRYEVGNVISTINVDSIAPTAPVTSLTDLISARAPGVTVEQNNGLTGSG